MFMQMAERQADVVDALRDTSGRDDWSHAYVHAEFGDVDGSLTQYRQGFLAVPGDDGPERAPLLIETEVGRALEAMHAAYAEAGQAFWRLDLLIGSDGRYRFDLDDTPSLILAGEPDPDARGRLERRFAELVRDGGL